MSINYHTKPRGRPKKESDEENVTTTNEQSLKRQVLLRGKGGSMDDPVDVLYAQKVISEEEASAIKLYKVMWARAYGHNLNYHGNVWASLLPDAGAERKEVNEKTKKRNIDNYHRVDEMLKSQSQEGRRCIRILVEGKLPPYLQSSIWAASKNFKLIVRLDDIEDEVKELERKKNIERNKEERRSIINEIDVLIKERRKLNKKLVLLSDKEEPYFNIYARDEFRLSLKALIRFFNKF